MKKNYVFIIFFVLTSCTFLPFKNQEKLNHLEIVKRKVSSTAKNHKISFFDSATLQNESIRMKEFDLNNELTGFKTEVEQFINYYAIEMGAKKSQSQNSLKKQQFVEGLELRKPYNSFDLEDKGLYFSAKKILSLIADVDDDPNNREVKIYQIEQLTQAIYQKYTAPAQDEYEILALPITILKHIAYTTVQTDNDVSTLNSAPEIHNEFISTEFPEEAGNLYSYKMGSFDAGNCSYSKPKTGYGVHSGFQIKCGGKTLKVKFGGEVYSGPFNTRVYSSLGYKVPTINYVEALRIKYNRKVIQEYNQRAALKVQLTVAGQNAYRFGEKIMRDPFSDISKFIMKDKSEISSAEAKARLMKKYDKNIDPADGDFNTDFENEIDAIVLRPATLKFKEENSIEIGPWRADDLNYAQFKEVRALMVLSAWVGNFDIRKDNLAIYLESPQSKNATIKVGISDAGAGLGKATTGFGKVSSSEINNMVWEVSATYRDSSGEGDSKDRIQLIGLMNIEANRVFQNINLSDAQWMLQKMCRLSKENIREALVASGMSSAEVVLATEKLIFRRNKMLTDFVASKELYSQCYVPADKKINYDPNTEGVVKVRSSDGVLVEAPVRGYKVRNGILTSN